MQCDCGVTHTVLIQATPIAFAQCYAANPYCKAYEPSDAQLFNSHITASSLCLQHEVLQQRLTEEVGPDFTHLVVQLLQQKPSQRLSAAQALELPCCVRMQQQQQQQVKVRVQTMAPLAVQARLSGRIVSLMSPGRGPEIARMLRATQLVAVQMVHLQLTELMSKACTVNLLLMSALQTQVRSSIWRNAAEA